MPILKKYFLLVNCFLLASHINAQQPDISYTKIRPDSTLSKVNWNTRSEPTFGRGRNFYLPAMLIGYGAATFSQHGLESINGEMKEAAFSDHPHKKVSVDNYLQFAPAATVYGLNAFGIKGAHNFRDRSMLFFMSNIFLNLTVFTVKDFTREWRPDQSARSSFPSGHTAEAFANAEFLRLEYKDVSAWYGIGGYVAAAATGYLRMYNNKHWLSDVVAGAGVGIASTRLAYWLYPKIQHRLFKDRSAKTVWLPSYQAGSFNVGMLHSL